MPKLKSLALGLVCVAFIATGIVSAQTVSIVSGSGQISCLFECGLGFEPLVVMVKDAAGNPIPNATVTWTVTSGTGTVNGSNTTTTTITDATGQSSATFFQSVTGAQGRYVQSSVVAAAGTSSVTFYETTALSSFPGNVLQVTPVLVSPEVQTVLSGRSGEQGATPIVIDVGVPNVAVQLGPSPGGTAGGPTAACVSNQTGLPAGVVLSDANGRATCTPEFSGGLGRGYVNAYVGTLQTYLRTWGPFEVSVAPGLPCVMRVVRGNNQTGNAGQNLLPLVASVTDCGGSPLEGVPVTWGPVSPAGGAVLSNQRTSTISGQVSTNLTLGSVPGVITIPVSVAAGTPTANGAPVGVSFTVTTNVVITGFQKVSGDNQEASQNTAFASPLTVQVTTASGPATGSVNFAVTSGVALLSAPSAPLNAQGQASVNVTAGNSVGPVVVTATYGNQSLAFNLTVRPPGPAGLTFFNSAWGAPGDANSYARALAPCSVATVTGTGIATGIQGSVVPVFFGPWPLEVANLSIRFGNIPAPIYSVSNLGGFQAATFQVPCETMPGSVQVTVRAGTAPSVTTTVPVQATAPGIFETTIDGRLKAVILKPDGSFADLGDHYLRKGEIARMFVTGVGSNLVPAISTNSPGIPDSPSNLANLGSVIVGLNGGGVRVVSVRASPGLIGVYEIAFQVPNDVPSGDNLELITNIGGAWSNASRVAIQ